MEGKNNYRKFYGPSIKTQLTERDVQTSKTVTYCMLECCQIMFGTRRDRVKILEFLLVKPIVMSSYNSTIIQCKNFFPSVACYTQ